MSGKGSSEWKSFCVSQFSRSCLGIAATVSLLLPTSRTTQPVIEIDDTNDEITTDVTRPTGATVNVHSILTALAWGSIAVERVIRVRFDAGSHVNVNGGFDIFGTEKEPVTSLRKYSPGGRGGQGGAADINGSRGGNGGAGGNGIGLFAEGGSGGSLGRGGTNGDPRTNGGTGIAAENGVIGVPGFSYGLIGPPDRGAFNLTNNIFAFGNTEEGVEGSVPGLELASHDHNCIFGFQSAFVGVSPSPHEIFIDSLFADPGNGKSHERDLDILLRGWQTTKTRRQAMVGQRDLSFLEGLQVGILNHQSCLGLSPTRQSAWNRYRGPRVTGSLRGVPEGHDPRFHSR